MKRLREEEEEEEEEKEVDWQRIFHWECILVVLHPYLSTSDLIHLSCVNKNMYTTWINNERRLSVLQMRNRVFRATGRKYNVKNPLLFLKKAFKKACAISKTGGKKKFKCWVCNRTRSVTYLAMDRERWPASTCDGCARNTMQKHYVRIDNVKDIYWYIYGRLNLWEKIQPRSVFDEWYRDEYANLEKIMYAQHFYVRVIAHESLSYLHKSFIAPFVERAREYCFK